MKYTDPDGRAGSFPDGSEEQSAQWERIMSDKEPSEKLTYIDIGLPESGPCNMRALIGVAEGYAGKNFSMNNIKKLINNLTSGSTPLVNKSDDYFVNSDIGVLGAAIDALMGEGTSDNLNIVIARPGSENYLSVKENATYSLLPTGRRDDSTTPGHWQVGDSKGNFAWDPLSGGDSMGRKIFSGGTRYITINPRVK